MRRSARDWQGLVFATPATVYLLAFSLVPMALAAWMSLHRWHLLRDERPFVGNDARHRLPRTRQDFAEAVANRRPAEVLVDAAAGPVGYGDDADADHGRSSPPET